MLLLRPRVPTDGLNFNFQLAWSSQSPVTELAPSAKGFHDVMGNAWEWAEDHYAPYPGFKVRERVPREGHQRVDLNCGAAI